MFKRLVNKITVNEQEVRESLNLRSEKELLIEVLIELKSSIINAMILLEK